MGIDRRLLLMDEFDWNYVGYKREDIVKTIKSLGYDVEASLYSIIIVDIGKNWPDDVFAKFKKNGVHWDSLYIQKDGDPRLNLKFEIK